MEAQRCQRGSDSGQVSRGWFVIVGQVKQAGWSVSSRGEGCAKVQGDAVYASVSSTTSVSEGWSSSKQLSGYPYAWLAPTIGLALGTGSTSNTAHKASGAWN